MLIDGDGGVAFDVVGLIYDVDAAGLEVVLALLLLLFDFLLFSFVLLLFCCGALVSLEVALESLLQMKP